MELVAIYCISSQRILISDDKLSCRFLEPTHMIVSQLKVEGYESSLRHINSVVKHMMPEQSLESVFTWPIEVNAHHASLPSDTHRVLL